MKTIRYYLSPTSPWAYLGHESLMAVAGRHGAAIEPRPIDLGGASFRYRADCRLVNARRSARPTGSSN